MEFQQLTRKMLNDTNSCILRDLHITTRCLDVTSTYVDYVALTFFVPKPTDADVDIINRYVMVLAIRCNWQAPRIKRWVQNNTITVVWQRSDILRTGNARLPD